MDDKLMNRAKQKYDHFIEVKKNGNVEQIRIAAIEAQVAIDSVRSDQGAVFVGAGEFGDHVATLAADEVWLQTAEAEIRESLFTDSGA